MEPEDESGFPPSRTPAWPPLPIQEQSVAGPVAYPVSAKGPQILLLGISAIVGAVLCGIFGVIPGIVAWVMANKSLAAIDSGLADPVQRKNIAAGRVCGIIGMGVAVLMFTISLIIRYWAGYYNALLHSP